MGRLGSFRIYLFAQLNGMIKDIECDECLGGLYGNTFNCVYLISVVEVMQTYFKQ